MSNLDAKLRVQIRGELARLHDRLETTIVYVTHDQIEAMTLADRIVIMNEGVIMQIGSPLEVFNNPKNQFVAAFIGSLAMNFLEMRVLYEQESLYLRGENLKLTVPRHLGERYVKAKDREAILGIRPQHIYDREIKGPFPGGEPLKMTVEVIEPVGLEVIVLGSICRDQLAACVAPKTRGTPNVEMKFLMDMNQIHLFDKLTGQSY